MSTLAARVLGDIQRQRLAPAGARVLVALSGGGDSVALLLLARELEAAGALTLAGAAHLNHQLRGGDADADEAFCRALTARLGVAFISERADVAEAARVAKRSVEDTARRVRYAFLERAATQLGADVVATAHTRDDQAETFLLRLLRGAGTRGLGAIRWRAGHVIRPLLDVSRAELRAWLEAAGEPFREDATNRDVRFPRNRVRHHLIPVLEAEFSPRIVDVLAREAALAVQDEDFLQEQAIELARRIVLSENDSEIRLDALALAAAPPALGSRIVHRSLIRLAGNRSIDFVHVSRVLALVARQEDGGVSLPGQEASVRSGVLSLRAGRGSGAEVNSFAIPLSIPGEVTSGGWSVAARELPAGAGRPISWAARDLEIGVAASVVSLPLLVRSRRPGDRFRPLGAPGQRKLQDFLVDRKVPRAERDTLPLVVDGRGRIVWVPGQSVAEEFRAGDPSQGVILLRARRLGPVGG